MPSKPLPRQRLEQPICRSVEDFLLRLTQNLQDFAGNPQRAEKGGLDPSWLSLAFLGRPDFQSGGPKTL